MNQTSLLLSLVHCDVALKGFQQIRVFPKVDHSANIARIVLFDQLLIKFLSKICQIFDKVLVKKRLNIYYIFIKYLAKFYLTINDPLPVSARSLSY